MSEKQEAYLIRLGGRPGSATAQETASQVKAEVRKLLSKLEELEDGLEAVSKRVTYLERCLEEGQYGD